MIDWTYLTDVFAAQFVFLTGFYLLLDRLPMGHFKRGYLLTSLVLSFLIPLLPLHSAAAAQPLLKTIPQSAELVTGEVAARSTLAGRSPESSVDWFTGLLWTVYLIGVLVGTLRLIAFLRGVGARLRRGSSLVKGGYNEVVLDDATPPHTFMRWVFYGREAVVAPAVLAHEAAHARQLHSVDRLLVAILRIVWWWNPMLLVHERAMAANHELLADRAVLNLGYPITEYQQTLLDAMRPATAMPFLASPAGFSLTKKRFAMMTLTAPSLIHRLPRYGLVTGIGVAAVLCFGGRAATAAPAPAEPATLVATATPPRTVPAAVASTDTIQPPPPFPDFWENIKPAHPNPPSAATLADWSDPTEYGIWIDGERVANQELENYSAEDFAHYFQSGLEKNAKDYGKYNFHIDVYTVDHFKKYNKIFPDGTFELKGRPAAPAKSNGMGFNLPEFDKHLLRLAGARPDPSIGKGC